MTKEGQNPSRRIVGYFVLFQLDLQSGRRDALHSEEMNGHKKAQKGTKTGLFVALRAFLFPFICLLSHALLCKSRRAQSGLSSTHGHGNVPLMNRAAATTTDKALARRIFL